MKKIREKIVSLICIVTMFVTTCFGGLIVSASGSSDITLQNAPEKDFTQWTFESVNIDNQTLTSDLNWEKPAANAANLDKKIFNAKILFPAGTGDDFGNFYIGGSAGDSASKYCGFLIRGTGSNAISLAFQNASGTVSHNIANLYPSTAGTDIRGNENLQFSLSVEYLSETNGVVKAKVGVFFNGKLYNNTYFTVENLPAECLTQHLKWKAPKNSPKVASHKFGDITLENAPEKDFDQWTFRDVNIDDQTLSSDLNWEKPAANAANLDKKIFNAKILFPAGTGDDFGNFYIGGSSGDSASKYCGFLIRGTGSNAISLAFQNASGTVSHNIANLYPTTAGTDIRGNENLQFSLSVEYLSEANGVVKAKVGVFFNGKLYNNTYFTVENLPAECLTQHLKWKAPKNSPKIASHQFGNITLENAPEKDFDQWTFRDVNIDNQTLTSDLNWEKPAANATNLDETIFNAKILFPAGTGDDFGNFYIGGSAGDSASKYCGFLIRGTGSNAISLAFQNASGTVSHNIANLYPTTAGTDIRGNENLQFSLSVEYLSETNGVVKAKVGVFFNGKLYNNTYFTVENLPAECLTQHLKWKAPKNSPKIASHQFGDITLENAPEKDFDAWTFRDVNIDDQTLSSDLNWEKPAANAANLDETIFNAKILFPAGTGDDFGNFYIGGSAGDSASKYCGFLIRGTGSNAISLAFQNASGTVSHNIANLYPTTAGTDIRGNENLQFSLSVEYLNETNGVVKAKVGVFFNGKLYNNTYFTVENLPAECLTQHLKWKAPKNSPKVASYPVATPNPGPIEDITLETAPEKDFDAWTFRDVEIDDQTVKTDLNWGSDWEYRTASDSLHQTLFQGKINFANGAGDAASFYIGGADVTDDGTATTSKYGGFVFQTVDTTGLKLGYQVSGTSTIYPVAEFNSTTAETQLRGNAELWLAFSVEYLSVNGENATLKLGVFFDGKLYDNTYYTIENIPTKYLNQNIRFKAVQKNNAVASYPEVTPGPTEDIYLKDAPEKDFACWTFDDFGINDQYLSVHLNWGDDFKKQTISSSLDKTIFNGLIHFPADTEDFGNFYLGGASKNDASKWRGFVFTANNTTDKLAFGFQGTDGNFFGKYGNTGSSSTAGLLTVFDPEVAGVTLRGNSKLQVSVSVEYTNKTDTTADLKVGVFFNGKLYNGTYFEIKQVPLEYLNQNIRYYAVGPNNGIASQHLCKKSSVGTFDGVNETYKDLTLRDFSILNQSVDKIEAGKDFRVENYRDYKTLNGTAVSVVCNFPKNGSARFSVGGSFWRGVYIGSREDGRLELCYVNEAGELLRLAYLDAATAGVESLTGENITIRLTFDVVKKSNTKSDLRLGVYVNGKLYDGTHYMVRNADTKTLTRTFKIYAVNAPFKIESIKTQPDLSIYGFDNKTWKSKI